MIRENLLCFCLCLQSWHRELKRASLHPFCSPQVFPWACREVFLYSCLTVLGLSLFPEERCSSPSIISLSLCRTLPCMSMPLLCWAQSSQQVWPHQCWVERNSLDLLAMLCPTQPGTPLTFCCKGTLLPLVQLGFHQALLVLSYQAAFQLCGPQYMLLPGFFPPQVQDFVFYPLDRSTTWWISHSSHSLYNIFYFSLFTNTQIFCLKTLLTDENKVWYYLNHIIALELRLALCKPGKTNEFC